jgi:hypothetical protein
LTREVSSIPFQSDPELYDPNSGWQGLVGGYSNQDPNAISAELYSRP